MRVRLGEGRQWKSRRETFTRPPPEPGRSSRTLGRRDVTDRHRRCRRRRYIVGSALLSARFRPTTRTLHTPRWFRRRQCGAPATVTVHTVCVTVFLYGICCPFHHAVFTGNDCNYEEPCVHFFIAGVFDTCRKSSSISRRRSAISKSFASVSAPRTRKPRVHNRCEHTGTRRFRNHVFLWKTVGRFYVFKWKKKNA